MNILDSSNFPQNPWANSSCPEKLDEDGRHPMILSVEFLTRDSGNIPFGTSAALYRTYYRTKGSIGSVEPSRAKEEDHSRNERNYQSCDGANVHFTGSIEVEPCFPQAFRRVGNPFLASTLKKISSKAVLTLICSQHSCIAGWFESVNLTPRKIKCHTLEESHSRRKEDRHHPKFCRAREEAIERIY